MCVTFSWRVEGTNFVLSEMYIQKTNKTSIKLGLGKGRNYTRGT